MKLCFSTLGCTEKTLTEILEITKGCSFDAVEIRGIGGVMDNSEIEDFTEARATETKNMFRKYGVSPVVLGTSCTFHSDERYEKAMVEGKESILIASRIGIPYIRVFGNNIVGDRQSCIAQVIGGIKTLCEFAKEHGVTVLLEVHGDFNTVEALAPVTDALGKHENFGIIWDVAHSHRVYGENWLPFYESIRPYIKHVHIKDVLDAENKLTLTGKGNIPIIPIAEKLLSDGYIGYFSLEWEKKWHPELEEFGVALKHFEETMKKCRQS